MKKKPIPVLAEKEILRRNPQVSRDLVDGFKKLENELRELGADTKPRFSISPPLGSSRQLLYNR
jgi:hypothetical protein